MVKVVVGGGLFVGLSVMQGGFLTQQSDPLVLCYAVFDSEGSRDVFEYVTKACCCAGCAPRA